MPDELINFCIEERSYSCNAYPSGKYSQCKYYKPHHSGKCCHVDIHNDHEADCDCLQAVGDAAINYRDNTICQK